MLMRSVSGVRGIVGKDITPDLVARYAAAFGTVLKGGRVVLAWDTRPTGPILRAAATAGLQAAGCEVVAIGIAPTPTVPLAVSHLKAKGGVAVTASHNPIEWNALKFLGSAETPLPASVIERIFRTVDENQIAYQPWDRIGTHSHNDDMVRVHTEAVIGLPVVDRKAIARRRPIVVYDAGGGAGLRYVPTLLRRLGCRVIEVNCTVEPRFPRGAEPIPKNLGDLCAAVRRAKADIGFATDPDSDRLAIVDERGRPLGEERTLTLATYWVLSQSPGPVVINLSTSRAVLDVAVAFNQPGFTAKVGEVNVAEMMKAKRAIIGGEGNGGVILPALHPGRDALLGIALVLSLHANVGAPISQIAGTLPFYHPAKVKCPRPDDYPDRLKRLADYYIKERQDHRDGVKIEFDDGSVHARPSNTEPIVRIMAEAKTQARAKALLGGAARVMGL